MDRLEDHLLEEWIIIGASESDDEFDIYGSDTNETNTKDLESTNMTIEESEVLVSQAIIDEANTKALALALAAQVMGDVNTKTESAIAHESFLERDTLPESRKPVLFNVKAANTASIASVVIPKNNIKVIPRSNASSTILNARVDSKASSKSKPILFNAGFGSYASALIHGDNNKAMTLPISRPPEKIEQQSKTERVKGKNTGSKRANKKKL